MNRHTTKKVDETCWHTVLNLIDRMNTYLKKVKEKDV